MTKTQYILVILAAFTLGFLFFSYDYKRPFESLEITNGVVDTEFFKTAEMPEEKISLDKIFDGINSESEDTWTLLVGGDVMIGRTVNYKTLTYNDFSWPYKNITPLLKQADFTFINLESPVIANCPTRNDGMIFCGNINHIAAIKDAGIDAVSVANNHMFNQGQTGLDTTLFELQKNNIMAVGDPNPTYMNMDGTRVALLAYTDVECYPGIACVDMERIKSEIATAKENSDLIVIMYHWGAEYRDYPIDRQVELAHFSIDNGADLVLGNHPHWIQPFEIYKGKLVMYSHGNMIFDQMWSQKTREGVLAEYIFKGKELVDVELHPVLIEDYGQPFLMEGEAKSAKVNFIREISEKLSTGIY